MIYLGKCDLPQNTLMRIFERPKYVVDQQIILKTLETEVQKKFDVDNELLSKAFKKENLQNSFMFVVLLEMAKFPSKFSKTDVEFVIQLKNEANKISSENEDKILEIISKYFD